MAIAIPDDAVRIVSYNILYGGEDRLELIAQTLRGLRADIVGLQEANVVENVGDLAQRLGFHHAVAESRVSPFHVALLSRWPIRDVVNLSDRCPALQRSALQATIDVGGEAWRVVVLHLAPGHVAEREALRMCELDDLLPLLDGENGPTVMMGDFNSTAPHHRHATHGLAAVSLDPVEAPAGVPGESIPPSAIGVPRDVGRRIVEAGWLDAIHAARPDEMLHTITPARPTTRVDYIWLRGDLSGRLVDAAVEQGGCTNEASDHYPIWAAVQRKG